MTVCAHAGFNATSSTAGRWLTTDHPSVPWPIRFTWRLANHGYGLGWVLLVLFVVALLIDARHLRAADRLRMADTEPVEGWAYPFAPGLAADRWAARLTPVRLQRAAAAIGAACTLATYSVRDLAIMAVAHVREPEEPRIAALSRGRASVSMSRALRSDALEGLMDPDSRARRRTCRCLAALAGMGLALAVFWLAPAWAQHIGDSFTHPPEVTWLAGVLDSLGNWWNSLSPGNKLLVGVGIAALVALSGGSLGLAFGISGAATFLLDRSHGAATFVRDPQAAVRSYLATTTPQGMLLDAGETLLTFAPASRSMPCGVVVAR